jgi:hypothetical protein
VPDEKVRLLLLCENTHQYFLIHMYLVLCLIWCGASVGGTKKYTANLILKVILYHFFTYDELVTS